jgi:hypothetical protein
MDHVSTGFPDKNNKKYPAEKNSLMLPKNDGTGDMKVMMLQNYPVSLNRASRIP